MPKRKSENIANNGENQLHPEMLGIHALNFAARHNSSSRSTMFSSHFSQRLVINGATESRIQTGMEQEFSKYTFAVKMPENGQIIKVIDRYPRGIGEDSLKFNPETIVIYENDETKEIDYFSIPRYCSHHQFFGFEYKLKDTTNLLKPAAFIGKDTVFADSPAVSENNGYMYGIELNVAFMSVPSVSEDGVMVSEDVLDKLKFKIFETRVVEFGAGQFPLNLYGNKDNYKPFPDIGDHIREDGVLMMLRTYDNDLMPVEMSIYDTQEPDFTFDKGVYVRGGEGRVIDIKVTCNNNPVRQLPTAMCSHVDKYSRALQKFYQEIIATEEKLRYERKKKFGEGKLKLSPKFHRLIVESLAMTNHNQSKMKHNLNLLYRKAPIDEYRVEFVIEYELRPTIGNKITDKHGGKGVFCKIEKPENMPVDADGNRADIVMDSAATISRMNLGRLYEHYLGGSARDTSKEIRKILNISGKTTSEKLMSIDHKLIEKAFNYALGYYSIVSQKQYDFFRDEITDEERYEHLADIVNEGIYLYYPIDNEKLTDQVVRELELKYKTTYGPVSYVGDSGERVTTQNNIRIAPLYLMLLDKIADDWSSVSSGKLQHFGVLSPMTKSEKFSYPYRNSPVRTIGETEGRIFAGYCGREAIAEMMDRSNNPFSQRNTVWNILNSETPGNIDRVVDRNYIPLGSNRPLQLVSHMTKVAGFEHVYEPEDKRK